MIGFLKKIFFLSLTFCLGNTFVFAASPTGTPPLFLPIGQGQGPLVTPATQACDYVSEAEKNACQICLLEKKSSWTVFGCLPTDPAGFVNSFLKFAISIGGGIAFLCILWGAFTLITSSGNPEKLNKGKEIIIYSVAGILLIIFSVVILKIIGVDILGIPGFK